MNKSTVSEKELKKSVQIGLKELKNTYKTKEIESNIDNRAQIAANLGFFYWKLENLPDSRKYFLLALSEYEKLKDEFKIANIQGSLGSLFLQMGEYAFALKYSEISFQFWKDKNYLNERIVSMQNMGICYLRMKEDLKATEIILDALQMAIHLEDEEQFAVTIQILLEYYEKLQRYDMLLELKRKALDFWSKLNLSDREFKTLIDLGVICQILEEYKTSIIYFKRAYNIGYNSGNIERMYLSEGFIGECFIKLGEIEKAKHIYLQAFKLVVFLNTTSDHTNDIESMRILLMTLGYTLQELANEEKLALKEAEKDDEGDTSKN
ncbi:MAG: tetratricopeptide repeat protein [Promethearchaeota archaeon]